MMDAAMAMGVASPGLLSEPVASARLDPNKLCGPNHKREKICRGFFKTRWSNFILLLKTEMRSRLLPSDAAAMNKCNNIQLFSPNHCKKSCTIIVSGASVG